MDYVFTNSTNSTGSSSNSSSKGIKKKKIGSSSKSKTMKLSTDPQSVAARERRHRISDRFKILQSMVPGGTKMDTASMLEEAINYVKFLKAVIWFHENVINFVDHDDPSTSLPGSISYFPESFTYSSATNNFTAPPVQQYPVVQASEPVALQDFNGFQGDESESLIYLDSFMKY